MNRRQGDCRNRGVPGICSGGLPSLPEGALTQFPGQDGDSTLENQAGAHRQLPKRVLSLPLLQPTEGEPLEATEVSGSGWECMRTVL